MRLQIKIMNMSVSLYLYVVFYCVMLACVACGSRKVVSNLNAPPYKNAREERAYIIKSPISYYEQSLAYINSSHPENGVERMKRLLQYHENFGPALQALANYHMRRREYRNALNWYRLLKENDTALFLDSYESYGFALAGDGQFIQASKHMASFLDKANPATTDPALIDYYTKIKKDFDFAVAYGKKLKTFMTVRDLKIKNMGPGINSSDFEYTPTISLNARRIIFTRRSLYGDEDLYEAYRKDTGWYAQAKPIEMLNTEKNEGSAALSTDNKKILITYCDREDGYGRCDLFISYYVEDVGWTPATNLGNKINTPYWESQPQFGPNNNSIYFSSDRPGGTGGKDIWVSYMDDQGVWGEPINLGSDINTTGDEELPFMHYDNETLYFASDGWQGYGKADLFFAKRITDARWEKPTNLGFPINTIDKEGGLIVQFDAKAAYFSSDKSDGASQGATDIYMYELPVPFRPKPSVWIQGKVFDAKSMKEISASVYITNLTSKRSLGKVHARRDGNFLITLPVGNLYSFNILKDGYLFYSKQVDIPMENAQAINKTFFLKPIEVGKGLILENIYFKTDEATLDDKSDVELAILLDFLNKNSSVQLQIEGHTDNVGSDTYNQDLSLKRAKAVERYLVRNGIAPFRLSTIGFGSSKPITNNTSESGRDKNRRCVIKITSF